MSKGHDSKATAKPILCQVTSDKMAKSRVGRIDRLVKHSRYEKYLRRQTKIMFHDELNSSSIGDSVLIVPCSPKSLRKRFSLLRIVNKAGADSNEVVGDLT